MPDLLPCPFCGSENLEIGGNFIQCEDCGGEMIDDDIDCFGEVSRRWNKRAPSSVRRT